MRFRLDLLLQRRRVFQPLQQAGDVAVLDENLLHSRGSEENGTDELYMMEMYICLLLVEFLQLVLVFLKLAVELSHSAFKSIRLNSIEKKFLRLWQILADHHWPSPELDVDSIAGADMSRSVEKTTAMTLPFTSSMLSHWDSICTTCTTSTA